MAEIAVARCQKSLMHKVTSAVAASRPLPVEIRICLFFACVWTLGVAFGLPTSIPDLDSLQFLNVHYFAPLLGAFVLQIPLRLTVRAKDRDDLLMLKLLPFLVLATFLHFNFKAWMPLVNPRLYDRLYLDIDNFASPIVELFCGIRQGLALVIPVSVDPWYHYLFVGMFFTSVGVHSLFDTPARQRQLVLGICLVLLVGGVLYWVAPALGPFLFREGLNAQSTGAQRHMFRLTSVVYEHGQFPSGYFLAPLAAMPSLHIAHALFFTVFAYRSVRWLFWIYFPVFLWIMIESVASGFHYLIDLPVGACVGLLGFFLAQYLVPESSKIPS